jgi:tetratricopeptide (TPR) repeat protein
VLLRLDVLAAVNEHKDCVSLAQRRLPKLRGSVDGRLVSEALLRLAASERVLGDLDAALEHVGEVLAATERGGAHGLRCRAKSLCGSIYEQRGQFDLSERYYADALELARAIGDELEEERARSAVANRRLIAGDIVAARADYDRLLKQAEQRGEKLRILGYVNALGIIAHEEGRYDEAELAYRRMMELAKPAGDRRSVAQGQTNVAVVRRDQGRHDDALSLCAKASRIFSELNQAEGLAYVRIVEAQTLLDRDGEGDAALAHEKAEEAFDLAERAGAALKLAEASIARGQALVRKGDTAEGLGDIERGLSVARDVNANRIVLFGLCAFAEAHQITDDAAKATACYREATSRAKSTGFTRFLKRLDDMRRKRGIAP